MSYIAVNGVKWTFICTFIAGAGLEVAGSGFQLKVPPQVPVAGTSRKCQRCRYRRIIEVAGLEVAGSGFKGEGAAAGAGRRSVFNNVAGAVIGEYLKSPVSKVAGNGIFKMWQSQSPAAAPAIRGMG